MNRPLTKKEWLEFLEKACDEFDWSATHQQREWVGLTDEERRDIREWQMIQEELGPVWAPMLFYFYLAIEAKLKEKNT